MTIQPDLMSLTFNNNLDLMALPRRSLTSVDTRVFLHSVDDTQPVFQRAVSSRVCGPAFDVLAIYPGICIRLVWLVVTVDVATQ